MNEKRNRSVKRRLIALFSGLVLGFVALATLVPIVVRAVAHSGLAAMGFTDSRGGSVSIGLHHLRIANIAIGRNSTATVRVTYAPSGVIRGHLDTIDVSNTQLHGVITLSGAIELDGYTASPPQPAPAGSVALPADRVTIDGATLELETPAGQTTLTASGALAGTDGALRFTGTVALANATMAGTAPADFTLSPTGWTATLNPIDIAFPSKTDAPNGITGHLSLTGATGAAIAGEAQMDGEKLTIQSIPVSRLSLRFKAGPDGTTAAFQLAPKSGGSGIDADLKSDGTGLTATLKAGFDEIDAFSKLVGAEIAGPVRASLTVHADPAATPRPVTLDLAYDGLAPGGVVLRNAKLRAAGAFDAAENALTLTSCGAFSADSVTMGGLTLAKLSGCLGPARDRALFDQDPAGKVALAAVVTNLAATANALAELHIASIQAAADTTDGTVTGFSLGLDGGAADLPGLGAGLRDVAIKARAAQDGAIAGTVTGSFGATAPQSPTLPIAGTLSGGLIGGMALALTVGSPDHLPIIKVTANGQGARLNMAATELGEGGADLPRLIPGLATYASKLSGTLALSLAADWSGQALASHGALTLRNVGATTPSFTIEGLDAAVTLPSLMPLATADNQSLTMKRLLVGVPLADGRITFGLDKHNRLNVADAHWSIADGTIATHGQQFDLYGPDQNLGVVVKGVELAQLLTLVNVNGLSAEGTVEGAIPLRRTGDIIKVERGVLQTSTAGVLRYDPADTSSFLQGKPGEGTAILRDTLKDFHYQQLGLTIDGVLGGEEQIKLTLNGANPTLYGGLPVALNVNLTGALDSIARSSIEAYTHPTETVRKKLQKKPGENK